MARFECVSIYEAGAFTTDSGNVIIPSGEEPFPMEEREYSLRFVVDYNSFNICVVT